MLVSGPQSSLAQACCLLKSFLQVSLGQSLSWGKANTLLSYTVLPQLLLQTFLLWVGHSRADKLPSTEWNIPTKDFRITVCSLFCSVKRVIIWIIITNLCFTLWIKSDTEGFWLCCCWGKNTDKEFVFEITHTQSCGVVSQYSFAFPFWTKIFFLTILQSSKNKETAHLLFLLEWIIIHLRTFSLRSWFFHSVYCRPWKSSSSCLKGKSLAGLVYELTVPYSLMLMVLAAFKWLWLNLLEKNMNARRLVWLTLSLLAESVYWSLTVCVLGLGPVL